MQNMETWPNFFIVGTPKAGTSSLYEYLKQIPGIYMSPNKEPNYFSITLVSANGRDYKPIRDKKEYLSLFSKVKNEKIIGEATQSYLLDPEAPKLIHEVSPNARILISLRDPVERIFSLCLMLIRQGRLKISFHDAIHQALNQDIISDGIIKKLIRDHALGGGKYTESVKRYQDIFGIDQVKIIFFEEWTKEPKKTVEEILNFLGLNYNIDDFHSEVYNPFGISRGAVATSILANQKITTFANKILPLSTKNFLKEKFLIKKVPKPKMDEKDQELLVNFYRDDVEKLQNLLSRKLPWKNFR